MKHLRTSLPAYAPLCLQYMFIHSGIINTWKPKPRLNPKEFAFKSLNLKPVAVGKGELSSNAHFLKKSKVMAVSVWNSACASIRFGVTSCLGTVPVILSDFTHEQQLEVLRELFPFLVFPYKYVLQDTHFGQFIHYTANAFHLPAHLREAVGFWPALSFCVNSRGRCAVMSVWGERGKMEEIIICGGTGMYHSWIIWCLWRWKIRRAPNLAYHRVGSSVGIFCLHR